MLLLSSSRGPHAKPLQPDCSEGDQQRSLLPVLSCQNRSSQTGKVLDALLSIIIDDGIPRKAGRHLAHINPQSVAADDGWALFNGPENKHLRALLKFQCSSRC